MSADLLVDTPADGLRVITLNRPQARNALHTRMQQDLDAQLASFRDDASVRAVIITGAGDTAFCAGYDIRELETFDEAATLANYELRRPLVWNVACFPKPLIGALNGSAHGAGAILAVAFDLRVGSERTDFRFTAAAYGGVNNTWHLPRVVGLARALDYTMTTRRVPASEAHAAGLLNQLVPAGDELRAAIALAQQIAKHPPQGIQWHKTLMRDSLDRSIEAAYAAENEVMTRDYRPGRPDALFKGALPSKKS